MMQSDRSEYGPKRQYGDRGTRQWDDYGDRREERGETHRDVRQNSYYKYCGNGHGSSERTSRGRDYSDSPPRLYAKDLSNRDRGRKSPVRRRKSSPDWSVSDRKKQRFTDDSKDDYRYRGGSDDRMDRQSPEFSHGPKDFKQKLPHQDDFKYGKTPPDSRSRHRQDEFSYRHPHDNSSYRRPSGYHADRDGEGSWHRRSPERMQPRDGSRSAPQSYARSRERYASPTEHKEHHLSGQSFEHQSSSKRPEEKKSSNGFQRFLDVLNKGVNVETLTKIVTQAAATESDEQHSPDSFQNTADRPPAVAAGQQEGHQYSHNWTERHHRSLSPKERSFSEDKSQRPRSRSPPAVEKIPLTPEDEHKRRQMQDVLQAIGLDLGFEELGQMSHRIQERLYGKKDGERGGPGKGSAERHARPPFSPRRQSRSSSSSRSSCNPSTQGRCSLSRDFSNTQSDELEEKRDTGAAEYGLESGGASGRKCETQKSASAFQTFPSNAAYTTSESPHPSVLPTYSPVNYPHLLYPPRPPALPQVHSRLLLPHRPPILPFPCVPPLNLLPAVLAQTRHILPPHLHQPPYLNLPGVAAAAAAAAAQPLSTTTKSKTLSRPRCLQVIETKQPG